jgi:prepilin peptidase CpaA
MSSSCFPAIALLVGVVAAITDYRTGRIPNRLTFSAMLLGFAGHSLQGLASGVESLLGTAVCTAVPGMVYKVSRGQGIGGGDIKLFAALGALLGPSCGHEVEFSSFLLVGVFALFRLAFLGQLTTTLLNALRLFGAVLIPRLRNAPSSQVRFMEMRMGPAILAAVATVLSLPHLARWLPWLG